jgi:hypothetical protein
MSRLYPIGFSIPESKIINYIPQKQKILSNLIPGKLETYIYNSEEEYYNEYRISYFAITMKKGGWDCMRHYEILANGCVPYFIDLDKCPEKTMTFLPKQLLIDAKILYKKFENKNINDILNEDLNEYNILIDKLLQFTKNYLSTNKIAKYILNKTNFENVTKILYLSNDTGPDYLRCLTLHGFKNILGSNCHDYPKIEHIYKSDSIDFKNLYGKGISYTNLLDSSLHNNKLDNSIEKDIINKFYDIIIYGSFHRGMPYYDLINKTYKPNEIILLCGEDIHICNYENYLNKGNNVFVRELN